MTVRRFVVYCDRIASLARVVVESVSQHVVRIGRAGEQRVLQTHVDVSDAFERRDFGVRFAQRAAAKQVY